nr:uncharacterized mitochondrial protein AtMg00810-like [Tanacetum cinerariifolium]
MHEKFQMSAMGELNFFLGLQVLQKEDGIFLSQDKYGKDGTRKDVDLHLYRSMIGSLMYLTASRPDIMFAVCACARYQVTPKKCHLHAVKRFFRYLKGRPKLGLWYPKDSPFDLVAYSDSDYGGASQDHKSTSGGCQFLGRRLISWQCKKKAIVATSTTKAEYVAAASCCRQVLWIQNQLLDYGLSMPCETLSKEISTSILRLIVPLFDSMVIQQGEGSGTPTEPHHTASQEAPPSSPTYISTSSIPTVIPIPTVTQSEPTPLRQYTRRARIAQSSALPPVADEPASPTRDVSKGEACPTDSGFIADQDRATIAKCSTLPHDTSPRVTSPAAVEGKDNQGVIRARSADDAQIKERRIDEEEGITGRVSTDTEEIRMDEGEVAVERTSGDTKEMATVLTSMDAATVLAGGIDVLTGSYSIPTAGPHAVDIHTSSDVVPTASSIGMIDSLDRTNKTIAKYLYEYQDVASELPLERIIELISDLVKYQDNYSKIYKFQSQQRRPWSKKQKKDYYITVIRNNLGWKVKDFKGMAFKEIKAKFAVVWKLVEDFIPMGSKEEDERLKRKGFNLEKEKAKKQKTSEKVPEKEKSPEEILEEKVKEMMQLVPIEEVYVQALQVKHPIIVWKVHIDGQRSYRKIIRLGGSSACYQFFVDLLKHLDRECSVLDHDW